jgi:hypothetical protein
MSNLPLKFRTNTEISIPTLSFNYTFDIIDNITTTDPSNELNTGISINQRFKIPAIILNLGGRKPNPNMAIAINGKTTLFNLYDAYITKKSTQFSTTNEYSFVIQGISTQNVTGEKILVFIPLNPVNMNSNSTNNFSSMISALKSESDTLNPTSNGLNIDLNKYIPSDTFYYYNYKDSNKTLYNIIAFDKSKLFYDTNFGTLLESLLKDKTDIYNNQVGSSDTATNTTPLYKSTSKALNQDSISPTFEDNIYIDCQPTENLGEKENYMQATVKEAVGILKYLEISFPYLIFVICLSLLVICIYSISYFLGKMSGGEAAGAAIESQENLAEAWQ